VRPRRAAVPSWPTRIILNPDAILRGEGVSKRDRTRDRSGQAARHGSSLAVGRSPGIWANRAPFGGDVYGHDSIDCLTRLAPGAVRRRGEELKRKTGVTAYGVVRARRPRCSCGCSRRSWPARRCNLFAYGLAPPVSFLCFLLAPAQPEAGGRARRIVFRRAPHEGDRLEVGRHPRGKTRWCRRFVLERARPRATSVSPSGCRSPV